MARVIFFIIIPSAFVSLTYSRQSTNGFDSKYLFLYSQYIVLDLIDVWVGLLSLSHTHMHFEYIFLSAMKKNSKEI